MMYRNKKLTESARHEACVSCGAYDATIVFAHSNSQKHGKGMGIKAHDLFGAYLCVNCHKNYDETSLAVFMAINDFAKTKQEWFIEMWERSMIIACEKGYLK
jgi:hypothetical protein